MAMGYVWGGQPYDQKGDGSDTYCRKQREAVDGLEVGQAGSHHQQEHHRLPRSCCGNNRLHRRDWGGHDADAGEIGFVEGSGLAKVGGGR